MQIRLSILPIAFLCLIYSCGKLELEHTSSNLGGDHLSGTAGVFSSLDPSDPDYSSDPDYPRSSDEPSSSSEPSSSEEPSKPDDPTPPRPTNLLSFIVIDNKFSAAEKKLIKAMSQKYDSIDFGESYTTYKKFFGGDSLEYLTEYLRKRIKYFVRHSDTEYQQIFGSVWTKVGATYSTSWLGTIVCANCIVPSATINGKTIQENTPRHGIIKSGPAFFESETTAIERISALVHEGRHADCPSRPSSSTVANKIMTQDDSLSTAERRCTNVHSTCSANESAKACDKHTWGSYAAQIIFLKKIYHDCTSCTEEEKQLANLSANAYQPRLLIDNPYSGTPNMSSFDE